MGHHSARIFNVNRIKQLGALGVSVNKILRNADFLLQLLASALIEPSVLIFLCHSH